MDNKKRSIVELLESSSDSEEEHVVRHYEQKRNIVLNAIQTISEAKKRRTCILNYLDDVVAHYDEDELKRHFRVSRSLFDSLTTQFEESDSYRKMRVDNRSITPKAHIAVFLWFAGHEACSYRDVADRFNLSLSSVNRVITRIIYFLSGMAADIITWPNEQQKQESSTYFKARCGFPAVIGCIDGTHIVIDPPNHRKDDYIDRKGNVTLVMQGVCNEKKKFIDFFVGYPGSSHDSWVLQNSPLYTEIAERCGNYYLLGDSAYPCLKNLMVPYKDNGRLTTAQINYNMKLGSGRVAIEHTFGILKQRFRQLYYCKLRGVTKLCHFIRACCVLHNIAKESDLNFLLECNEDVPANFHSNNVQQSGNNIRNEICQQLQENI